MTVRTTISIADGETSPVTHAFVPDGNVSPTDPRVVFVNRNVTVPGASEKLFATVKRSPAVAADLGIPGKAVQGRSASFRIEYPQTYVDTGGTGLTLLDFVDSVDVKFNIHPRSSEQRAKNLRCLLSNLMLYGGNQVLYAVDKGEAIW